MPIPKKFNQNDIESEFVSGVYEDEEIQKTDNDILNLDHIDLEEDFDLSEKQGETPREDPAKTKSKQEESILIKYSSRAFSDGYRFNSLSVHEQRMTRHLYISEDVISSYYLARERYREMGDPDTKRFFKYGLGIPHDGTYLGIILGCQPSKTSSNSYVLKILMSEEDVRFFSFTPGIFNPVSQAISVEFGIRNNAFKQKQGIFEDLDLEGYVARFNVENTETKTGEPFSTITSFDFLSSQEISVLDKMVNIMLSQS